MWQQEAQGPWRYACSFSWLEQYLGISVSSHVATSYVDEVTNPNFEIWRPKWPWLYTKWSKCNLYTNTWGTRVIHIICCTSMPSRFWTTSYFQTRALNDHYICSTSIPGSQISVRFALRPEIFELQNILRQMHRMTPKRPWIMQG